MSIYPPLRSISISVDIDVFCTYPCRYRPIISAAGSYQIYEVNCISPGGSLCSQITYTISIFLNINIHAIYRLIVPDQVLTVDINCPRPFSTAKVDPWQSCLFTTNRRSPNTFASKSMIRSIAVDSHRVIRSF